MNCFKNRNPPKLGRISILLIILFCFYKTLQATNIQQVTNIELYNQYKDTKFESNSQLLSPKAEITNCCIINTKIQNLKAIHNLAGVEGTKLRLYNQYKDTKFESNSQRTQVCPC